MFLSFFPCVLYLGSPLLKQVELFIILENGFVNIYSTSVYEYKYLNIIHIYHICIHVYFFFEFVFPKHK